VLANAKHCPKCRRPIEKSTGCSHMRCPSPCGHEFCWICLGNWHEHMSGTYQCNRYVVEVADARRHQARASLDRYLHYYERWAAHEASRQIARENMFELESTLAACAGSDEARTQIGFLMDAYTQILEGRRMLRWTYAYGFYADGVKLNLLECLQGEAEASLERLHGFAELERNSIEMDLDGGATYFKNLASLTKQTAKYFENMADAFQTDLA
jgi:ariadne-1